jgi:hypothetical protein
MKLIAPLLLLLFIGLPTDGFAQYRQSIPTGHQPRDPAQEWQRRGREVPKTEKENQSIQNYNKRQQEDPYHAYKPKKEKNSILAVYKNTSLDEEGNLIPIKSAPKKDKKPKFDKVESMKGFAAWQKTEEQDYKLRNSYTIPSYKKADDDKEFEKNRKSAEEQARESQKVYATTMKEWDQNDKERKKKAGVWGSFLN